MPSPSIHPLRFLKLIRPHELGGQIAGVAPPIRILMDLVELRSWEWHGLDWLTDGRGIGIDGLPCVPGGDLNTLAMIYKQHRPRRFSARTGTGGGARTA